MHVRVALALALVLLLALSIAGCGDGNGTTDSGPIGGDSGALDGGPRDGGAPDARPPGDDAGGEDAGVADGGIDASTGDAGESDAGASDAGAADAGTVDGGSNDAGSIDGGSIDGGSIDGGSADAALDAPVLGDGATCDDGDPCTVDAMGPTGCTHTGAGRLLAARGNNIASDLYVLDPATGARTTIGPTGVALTGMAQHPITRVVYGVTTPNSPANPRSLVTIDTATGAVTLVGATGATIADISFAADGTLYGWLEVLEPLVGTDYYDDLVRIDVATGVVTVISDSMLDTYGSGLAFAPDGRLFFAGEGNAGALRLMSPTTGLEASIVGTLAGGGGEVDDAISALAFGPGGVLFGIENVMFGGAPANLISIDVSTAAITVRGATIERMDALVYACP